jgi:hypothetical protein
MAGNEPMDIAEFVSEGYLQEVNRRFFHPLGLALAVSVNDDGTDARLACVWDARDDPEGFVFDDAEASKAANIDRLLAERAPVREAALGFVVEPAES